MAHFLRPQNLEGVRGPRLGLYLDTVIRVLAMLHRFFWLALLGAWSGFVFGTWAWARPIPTIMPKPQVPGAATEMRSLPCMGFQKCP